MSAEPVSKKPCPSALGSLKELSEIVADTADYNALPADAVDATTNPTLITKVALEGGDESLITDAVARAKTDGAGAEVAMHYLSALVAQKIQSKLPGVVSLEINPRYSFDKEKMLKDVRDLMEVCKKVEVDMARVVVKIPATWEGIEVCKVVASGDQPIKVNMTLVFSVIQAMACVDANAYLISPFVGRVTDYHTKETKAPPATIDDDAGVKLVREIYTTLKKYRPDSKTIVMAASFRNIEQILAVAGCSKITISPKLVAELADIPARTLVDENAKIPVQRAEAIEAPAAPLGYSDFMFGMSKLLMPQVLLSDGVKKFDESWNQTQQFLQSKL